MNLIQQAEDAAFIKWLKPYWESEESSISDLHTMLRTAFIAGETVASIRITELEELLEARNNQEDYAEVWAERNGLQARITGLEAALSGRTHHHSDADIERELNEAEDRIIALEQRLASKEDALAAALLVVDEAQARVAELETEIEHYRGIAITQGAEKALADYQQLQADSRQLAEALLRAHGKLGDCTHIPCTCPACQTARRVLCESK